MIRQLFRVV